MFSKPLNEITIADIETFCKEYSEGVRVEYKSDFPENIPKTISAFANTMGGIVIIGVETNEKNMPILPLAGIPKQQGIEEKIQSSSLQGIYPPVLPSVRIVDIPESDKVLVVIKISESAESPHAIENSTKVYIRTGSQSRPYDLADIDRIEYLLNRREKPKEFRDKILARSKKRFEDLIGRANPQCKTWVSKTEYIFATPYPNITISICPTFPRRPLFELEQIPAIVNKIPLGDRRRHFFSDNSKKIANGFLELDIGNDYHQYSEVNEYGLFFHSEGIQLIKGRGRFEDGPREIHLLKFPHIVWEIGKTLKFAEHLYGNVGFWGNIEIEAILTQISDKGLTLAEDRDPFIQNVSLENEIASNHNFNIDTLRSDFANIVQRIAMDLSWVFEEEKDLIVRRTQEILSKLWPKNP